MGSNNCCSRDKIEEHKITVKEKYEKAKIYSKEKYNLAKVVVSEKVEDAKIKYAPQIEKAKIKYDEARMRVKGYTVDKIEDLSETGMVTEFELRLPLCKIDIDEYERRLKKLAD